MCVCVGGEGGGDCLLIIWRRLPNTGQCCIDCMCGGVLFADHLEEVALHRSALYRLCVCVGGGGGWTVC